MNDPSRARIARLKRGDPTAFDEVYDLYRPRLFAFLARLCGRRDLAEDLLQDTFLRLVRFAPRLADDTRLDVWLYTVARNVYLSHRRWALVDMDRTLSLGRWIHEQPTAPSPFDMTAATELSRNLERALLALPLTYREALVLVVIENLSTADAAGVLGISADSLRQRVSRGRKLLGAALESATAAPAALGEVKHGV